MRVYPPKKLPSDSHHHFLTDIEKGRIIQANYDCISHNEIGKELNIPARTVSAFLKRVEQRRSVENLPRPGRPRKTSAREDRYIIRTALDNTKVTNSFLRDITNQELSVPTIRRRLREDKIRKWRAVKRPLLTKEHARQRLEWARRWQHLTLEDWKRIIWSDECAVQRDSDGAVVWVFRHQNAREKYDPKNIRGKTKGGYLFQLIWGCFAGSKLGPIVFVDGTVDSDVYMGILQENLLPFIDALVADGLASPVFQQDNATSHASKKTRDWFKVAMKEHGFLLMEWPPNSPDLNPIEHLWAYLKRELHRRYPDTKYLKGSPEAVKRLLRERLVEVWWDIGEVLNTLIESMPDRVQAVKAARGWYTDK
jgi:Transposase/DDE superfamily endonuclease